MSLHSHEVQRRGSCEAGAKVEEKAGRDSLIRFKHIFEEGDLQSGLPAEIEARRKQYEYYREKLLTFE